MPTVINTGPNNPEFYTDKIARVSSVFAAMLAANRKRQEEEAAKRAQRAQQIYKAVSEGAIRPDDARVETAYTRLAEFDPQSAEDLRLQTRGLHDQMGAVNQFHDTVFKAQQGYTAASIQRALSQFPPHVRTQVMKSAGITPAMMTPKDPDDVPEPKDFEEAIMQGVSGARPMGEAQAMASIYLQRETQKRKAAEEMEFVKAEEGRQRRLLELEEAQKIKAKYRPAKAGKEPKSTKIDLKEISASQARYRDDIRVSEPKGRGESGPRPVARQNAEARILAYADSVPPEIAAVIRQDLAAAREASAEPEMLAALEAKLRAKGLL